VPATDPAPSLDPEPSALAVALSFDEPSAVAIWVLGSLGWILAMRAVFRGHNPNG